MMAEAISRPGQGVRQETWSALLVGAVQPNVAAVFRVVRHAGATDVPSLENRLSFTFAGSASSQWLGWYSPQILANGWQPYDQPHHAAYIPLGYDRLIKHAIEDHGVLLRQSSRELIQTLTTHSRALLLSCPDAELPRRLVDVLEQAGVPAEHVDFAIRFFLMAERSSDTNAA